MRCLPVLLLSWGSCTSPQSSSQLCLTLPPCRILTAFHQMGLQPDDLLDAVESWANQRLRKLSPQVGRGSRARAVATRCVWWREGNGGGGGLPADSLCASSC